MHNFLAGFCTVLLLTGCAQSIPTSQSALSTKLAELRRDIRDARDSGNSIAIQRAESSAKAFLQSGHDAENWRAHISHVSALGEEVLIDAKQSDQTFHLRIADPTLKAWASARTHGDAIEFSGHLGRERSITIAGGLDEPEFLFWPSTIRLLSENQPHIQRADVLKNAIAKERQRVLDDSSRMELSTICQDAIRGKLAFPEEASFSWLDQHSEKVDTTHWIYGTAVDTKNAFGATFTHHFICHAVVAQRDDGTPSVKILTVSLQ